MGHFAKTPEYMIETKASNVAMPSMHVHSSYELYYLEVGSRDYFVEDKLFRVSAGNYILIPPGKLHRTGGAYGMRTLVNFTYDFLRKTYTPEATERLLNCFDKQQIIPSEEQQESLRKLLKQMSLAESETAFAIYLGMLLEELGKCSEALTYDKYISGIIGYINLHYGEISSIEQIAEHFYVSKYHLCRAFKKAMEITLIDYLSHVRVKNACGLLESSKKSILEISQICGFNSVSYFSKVFRKFVGVSPSVYRTQIS